MTERRFMPPIVTGSGTVTCQNVAVATRAAQFPPHRKNCSSLVPSVPDPVTCSDSCAKLRRMADHETDPKASGLSRRDLLKRAGLAGAALTLPLPAPAAPAIAEPSQQGSPSTARREPLESLSASESDLLEAICGR